MNEFAPYGMQAPPLKRHTRQRFTEFDYGIKSDVLVNSSQIKKYVQAQLQYTQMIPLMLHFVNVAGFSQFE